MNNKLLFEDLEDEPQPKRRKIPRRRTYMNPDLLFTSIEGRGRAKRRIFRKGGKFLALVLMILSLFVAQVIKPLTVDAASISPNVGDNGSQAVLDGYPWQSENAYFPYYTSYALVDFSFNPGDGIPIWATPGRAIKVIYTMSTTDFLYTTKVNGNYYVKCPETISCHEFIIWFPHDNVPYHNNFDSPGNFYTYVANDVPQNGAFTKLYHAKNLVKTATWDISSNWTQAENGGQLVKKCAALDLVCKMANLWDGVTETFSDVGKRLLDGITAIFVPDNEVLSKIALGFDKMLQDRLGILYYPIQFLTSVGDTYAASPSNCTSSSCNTNFGTFMGKDFNINFAYVGQNLPELWTAVTYVIRALVILGVILLLHKFWLEVMN